MYLSGKSTNLLRTIALIKPMVKTTAVPNGIKLSHLCMNPGYEPGTVDNDTP
jgi:hypothetical protein